MIHVAGKTPRVMNRDRLRFLARLVDDLDLAGLDDEEFEITIAGPEKGLSGAKLLRRGAGMTPELRDLLVGELRECD